MTSPTTKTSNDSSSVNKSPNDINPKSVNNIDNENNQLKAQDKLDKDFDIENGNNDGSNDNRDKESAKELAAAQAPEAKIKMETVAPDVVIASLETTEADSQPMDDSLNENAESETFSTEENFFQDQSAAEVSVEANKINSNQQSSNDTKNSKALFKESPETLNEKNEDKAGDNNEASNQKDNKEVDKESYKEEDNEEEEDEDEEVKEAKLESYKQFVAEQFSNKKVDYPEVRVRIEANALPSKMYFIMNILSAIIASYGLVTNSAAVVIGAMLVAMMLGPITGIALAIIDHRMPLLRKSLVTVLLGISLVVLVGFIVGWLHKDQPLTVEILSRTQPTSMDLMIALAGGTAGAYAMVSPHLSVAVVGVAVATALVPPLAASGILFANGEMQMGLGALLLALTNIIAIQFTNALVLWLLGFRRLVDDDYKSKTYLTFLRRNAVTLLLLGGLGTYLSINLQTSAKQQGFENNVKETINSYFSDKGNVLTNTQFDKSDTNQVVRAVIRGETTPSSYDVRQIEAIIEQDMADNFPGYLPIKLQLRYMPVQVIESHPLIQDKLDKTDVTILTN